MFHNEFGESVLVYNLDSITAVQYVIPVPNLKSNCLSDKDVLEVWLQWPLFAAFEQAADASLQKHVAREMHDR